jgi:hypothetical protein
MLKNLLTFGGETIVTIYHKGFDEDVGRRNKRVVEKLGRLNLKFEEYVVPDDEIEQISYNGWTLKGLLGKRAVLNPYGEGACAFIEQLVCIDKPQSLFSDGNQYTLKVDVTTFQKICNFAKRYTGIDFSKTPLSFGNIFIFSSSERNFHALKDDGIVVRGNIKTDHIIVHFKQNDLVVFTKIIDTAQFHDGQDIEIVSDEPWDCYDIEMYSDGRLIYYDRDVAYMRSIVMNMTSRQKVHSVPLKKLGKDFKVESEGVTETTIIGEKKPLVIEKLERSNSDIRRRLNNEESDHTSVFIKPNEVQKAMNFIQEELKKRSKEVWLFDSYFSDRNGINYAIDWIRILAFCNADEKNIVFFNNRIKSERNSITATEFSNLTREDSFIRTKKGKDVQLGIQFCQTKQYIHDRFLFILDKDQFVTGLTIGTSLNSLDSNYFCIQKLHNGTARIIFDELRKFVEIPYIEEKSSI